MQVINTCCGRRALEIEQVKNYFRDNDYQVIQEDFIINEDADVLILAACGFTQAAEDFGLNMLKSIEEKKKPGSRVIVGGCLPKINPDVTKGYNSFDPCSYEKLDEYMNFEKKINQIPRPNTIETTGLHSSFREHGLMGSIEKIVDSVGRKTRTENVKYVKAIHFMLSRNSPAFRIQCLQGCACNCSYCAIKLAIGKLTSRPIEEIITEIKVGIEKGYKRVFLEGDSLGGYGEDIGTNFGSLLEEVIKVIENTDVKISIPDISPKYLHVCYRQIIRLAEMRKLFNFYIPIQSGSQIILDSMKRRYDIEKVKGLIHEIKKSCPSLLIGTSIIVGFPGETMEDLEKTIQVCRDIKFDYIYCHSFSERKGTAAANLPDKIPDIEILRRSRLFKKALKGYTTYITIAEDTRGNKTCQG